MTSLLWYLQILKRAIKSINVELLWIAVSQLHGQTESAICCQFHHSSFISLCSDANMKSLHCKESKDPNQEILISWWNVWLHCYLKTAAPNSFCLCIMSCMLPAAHQQLWRQTAECLDMQSSVQMYQHEDRAAVLLLLIHPPSSLQSCQGPLSVINLTTLVMTKISQQLLTVRNEMLYRNSQINQNDFSDPLNFPLVTPMRLALVCFLVKCLDIGTGI